MMIVITLLIILILILTLALVRSTFKDLPENGWTYKLVDKKARGPNADQGYWVTKDSLGRECWFTDDALRTAIVRAATNKKR